MSANSVDAVCIHVTGMDPFAAFIDIYNRNDTFCTLRLKVDKTQGTPVMQFAFTSQSWLSVMHSSTCTSQTTKKELFNFCYKVVENGLILKESSRGVYFNYR